MLEARRPAGLVRHMRAFACAESRFMNKIILAFATIAIAASLTVFLVGASHTIWYFAIFVAMISILTVLALVAALHGDKLIS